KMLLHPSNLIVMDEPTNHLDMRSKGVLQEALALYEGSFVIVSHDRDFLDPIVTKVVDFRHGALRTYPGNVSDYIDARGRDEQREAPSAQRRSPSGSQSERERKRLEAEERQRRYKKNRPLREKIEALERDLEEMEKEKSDISRRMADPGFYRDGEQVKQIHARYRQLEKDLGDGYFRWNELTKQIEDRDPAEDSGRRGE
ncbi:MAG TPA: ABC transporter ATP-binding protein, partial [Bacteroidota bacterium]|nr:ABC transporter ATP-binding protein [Bacteroidota bacterium]